MYFADVSDEDLNRFHESVKNNFQMFLNDAMFSHLFLIEEIVSDSIYQLYPLFYCENIRSDNPNDVILDNKCIICQKNDYTTLFFESEKGGLGDSISIDWSVNITAHGLTVFVYDRLTLNPIPNVKVTTAFKVMYTDENGICYDLGYRYYGSKKIILEYDGIEYNIGGEW